MRDFLSRYLNVYWLNPGLALWRAIEAKVILSLWSELFSSWKLELHYNVESREFPTIDFGCGNGVFSFILGGGDFEINHDCYKKKSGRIRRNPDFHFDIGLDCDYKTLKLAKNIGAYKYYVQANISNLPFKKNTFKTLFCNGILEHCETLREILSEIHRVAKTEGEFVTTVSTNYFGKFLLSSLPIFHKHENASHIHQYTQIQWKEELRKTGFNLISSKEYLHKPVIQLWAMSLTYHNIHFLSWLSIKTFNFLDKVGIRNFIKAITVTLTKIIIYKYYKNEELRMTLRHNKGVIRLVCADRQARTYRGAFVLLVARRI